MASARGAGIFRGVALSLWLGMLSIGHAQTVPAAPRAIAEYEKMQGVLLVYEHGFPVPSDFLRLIARKGRIYCLVLKEGDREPAGAALQECGIDPRTFELIVAPFDSPWTRDYGPVFVEDDGRVCAVDFAYDRPRPRDDVLPRVIAADLGIPFRSCPLVHTGGNLLVNGQGAAISSSLVFRENGGDAARVRAAMAECFGVGEYLVFDDPTRNYHEHANCWIKFLDARNIALKSVPASDHQGSQLLRIQEALESRGYRVHPIPTPHDEPYLNALLYNGTLFVPTVGNPDFDEAALAAYRRAMPTLEVIGVPSADWLRTDALACRVLPIPEIRYVILQTSRLQAKTSVVWQAIEPVSMGLGGSGGEILAGRTGVNSGNAF